MRVCATQDVDVDLLRQQREMLQQRERQLQQESRAVLTPDVLLPDGSDEASADADGSDEASADARAVDAAVAHAAEAAAAEAVATWIRKCPSSKMRLEAHAHDGAPLVSLHVRVAKPRIAATVV